MSSGSGANLTPAQCELLCFMSQKRNVMAVDDIVKICGDFYTEDEIMNARALLEQSLPERLSRRQGPNKCRVTLVDLLKTLNDPNSALPMFYASDISRLPPVSASHCDVSAILAELQQLRAEVRSLCHLSEEVSVLRQEVSVLRQEMVPLRQLKAEVDEVRKDVSALSADVDNFPPLPGPAATTEAVTTGATSTQRKLFADHALLLRNSGMSQQKSKRNRSPVVGSSSSNDRVSAVSTVHTIDIFISRLHPQTTMADVKECVDVIKGDEISVDNVECEKLKARYEHLYASFYVKVQVKSSEMKRALELFMCEKSWPNGVLVRRYFSQKQRNG